MSILFENNLEKINIHVKIPPRATVIGHSRRNSIQIKLSLAQCNTALVHTTAHDTCRLYQPAAPRAILAEPNDRRQRLRYRGSKQMLLFKKKGLLNIELPPTSNLLKTNEKEKKTQYL